MFLRKTKLRYTDATKINRPEHNIRMYWTNFRTPTAHVQQIFFGKTSIEVRSPHLCASFWHLLRQSWSKILAPVSLCSMFIRVFSKIFCCTWTVGCKKFRQGSFRFTIERSVKMWATNFYERFFKYILSCLNNRLSKIRSVHTYGVR